MLITGRDDSSEPLHVIAEAMQSLSNATFSKANYLEIIPLGTNKAEALGQLIASLGLDLSQLAAIGDGLNDLEMLREAGLGIAMGNAPAAVQSVADWVTNTNDQAGVAQAVRRLFQEGFI
jgi:hydroxymethylpyrimidine pyrophosphatase-like HAD family hydrolase